MRTKKLKRRPLVKKINLGGGTRLMNTPKPPVASASGLEFYADPERSKEERPFFHAIAKTIEAELQCPPRLSRGSFPNCCGISVLYGFGHAKNAGHNGVDGINLATVEADIKEKLLTYGLSGYGLHLIALSSEQVAIYGALLTKLEFYPLVKDFLHKGHGNKLTLYGRVSHPAGNNKKGDIPIEIVSRHRDESTTQT